MTPTELKNLQISRVSLVDKGAGEGVRVTLFKRHDIAEAICQPILKAEEMVAVSFNEAMAEAEGRAKAYEMMDTLYPMLDTLRHSVLSIYEAEKGDARKAKVRESVSQFQSAVKEKLSELAKRSPRITKEKEGEPMTAEEHQKFEDLTKNVGELTEMLKSVKADNESLRKRLAGDPPPPDTTPITKADLEKLDPAGRKAVEDAIQKAAAADERIAKLERENEINQVAHDIEKRFPNISDDPREWAEMLIEHKPDSPQRKRLEKMLETNNAAMTKLTTELGIPVGKSADGSGAGDAYGQLVQKAHKIQESNANLSDGEALDMACKQNPEIYRQYREEEA